MHGRELVLIWKFLHSDAELSKLVIESHNNYILDNIKINN